MPKRERHTPIFFLRYTQSCFEMRDFTAYWILSILKNGACVDILASRSRDFVVSDFKVMEFYLMVALIYFIIIFIKEMVCFLFLL